MARGNDEPTERLNQLHIMLSDSEYEGLVLEKEDTGMPMAELVRRRVFQGKWRRPPAIKV